MVKRDKVSDLKNYFWLSVMLKVVNVKLWICLIAAQMNECHPLPSSYNTEVSCSPEVTSSQGSEVTCRVMCEAGAQFASDRSEFTTSCGPSTDFSWTHESTSRLLPSCSGQGYPKAPPVTQNASQKSTGGGGGKNKEAGGQSLNLVSWFSGKYF